MIGMVNISEGRLSGTQIGFFNQIAKDLRGAQFGFNLGSNISIVASPSVAWQFVQKGQTLIEPIYSLYKNEFNPRNALYFGLHFGLRYAINQ